MKIFLLFLISFPFALSAMAQHCPYDGGEMLVIELRDRNDELIFGAAPDLTLVEIENPNADACKYAPGMLSFDLRPPIDAFMARYQMQSSDNFTKLCADCSYNRDGFYAVVIGQAERHCMIEEDMGVRPLRRRQYEVRYKQGDVEQTLRVEPHNFFSMCTGTGKWSRFKPLKFKIEPAEKKTELTTNRQ